MHVINRFFNIIFYIRLTLTILQVESMEASRVYVESWSTTFTISSTSMIPQDNKKIAISFLANFRPNTIARGQLFFYPVSPNSPIILLSLFLPCHSHK